MQKYSEFDQEIRRKLKQVNENWITDRRQEIILESEQRSKAAFNTLKLLAQRQQAKLIENTRLKS